MHINKLLPDILFDGYKFLENSVLVLENGKTVIDIIPKELAGDDVQQIEGILSPGFINCHCHLELSHMKKMIAENTGLTKFIQEIISKRDSESEKKQIAIAVAENEMLQNGIVAVGDICNTVDTISQKNKGNLYYHNFIEVFGSHSNVADTNFRAAINTYEMFVKNFGEASTNMVPHAPYSVSGILWKYIVDFPENNLLSLHNQETEAEDKWFKDKTGDFDTFFKELQINTTSFEPSGTSSLQTYFNRFLPTQQLILVHNVHTTVADIQYSKSFDNTIFWCLCPQANRYITNTLPDVPMFIQNDAVMVLGTDSLASNHQLSIWAEIQTLLKHFSAISLEQALVWATSNGAKALKIDDKYGSFEKGKQPGLVQINNNKAVQLTI